MKDIFQSFERKSVEYWRLTVWGRLDGILQEAGIPERVRDRIHDRMNEVMLPTGLPDFWGIVDSLVKPDEPK